jgi:uncharacterized LabA/DUF88 family protein
VPVSQRVIGYVDGFNLYFGLRQAKLKQGYWLDVPGLLRRYLPANSTLIHTNYFTSRVTTPADSQRRQNEYIEALSAQSSLSMRFGKFAVSPRTCRTCQATWTVESEKMTDVNIAVSLLTDAMEDRFDVAIVLSADSDLVPPIDAIRRLFPSKSVIVAFPPCRGSVDLARSAHEKRKISAAVIMQCQLPNAVMGIDGHLRTRPQEWS